ncbi:hypothetical protein Ddc_20136 [Ditylenchus destructor]|nr:hypothetical protein Ddc_20136 [Ditylenchus destructor]
MFQIWPNPTADVQMILYEMITVSTIYPIINAILLAHGTGQIKRLFSGSSNQTTPIQMTQNEEQDVYFERLKQLFEANAPRI